MSHEITLKNISAIYMEVTIETKCPRASACSKNLKLPSALWEFGKKNHLELSKFLLMFSESIKTKEKQ